MFFDEIDYHILAIADAYNAHKLARIVLRANESVQAVEDCRETWRIVICAWENMTGAKTIDETMHLLQCIDWGDASDSAEVFADQSALSRDQYPWIPPRSDDSLKSARAFFRRHHLKLRTSKMFRPRLPNVLGIYARQDFNEGHVIFRENCVTGILGQEAASLRPIDDLLERFIRRLTSSHWTYKQYKEKSDAVYQRNVPVLGRGKPVDPPWSQFILEDQAEATGLKRFTFMANNAESEQMLAHKRRKGSNDAAIRLEVENVDHNVYHNFRALHWPYSVPDTLNNKFGHSNMDIDMTDVRELQSHPMTVHYKHKAPKRPDYKKARPYHEAVAVRQLVERRKYGLNDHYLAGLTTNYSTPPESFHLLHDVIKIADLVDKRTDRWYREIDFWIMFAMKWRIDTNSFYSGLIRFMSRSQALQVLLVVCSIFTSAFVHDA